MVDPILQSVISIAKNGSEFGPHYDAGSQTVIRQIKETGHFKPNQEARLAHSYLTDPPHMLDDDEKLSAKYIVEQSGLPPLDATQYFRGICHTEDRLRDYVHPEPLPPTT